MSVLVTVFHAVFVGLVYLAMLLILVAAHEFGHYLFARLFGMGAEEFALGMGGRRPWIYARRRYAIPVREGEDPRLRGDEANALEGGGATVPPVLETKDDGSEVLRETTLFTIRPYPLGGFVRIKGMMPREDGSETKIPGGFFSKSPLKRWIVLAAGPAFSVIAGILLLVTVMTMYGWPKPTTTIRDVPKTSAAYKAGLRPGDRITSINGARVDSWFEMTSRVRDQGDRPIAVVADRGGKPYATTFKGDVDKTPVAVLDANGAPTGELRRQTRLGVLIKVANDPLPFGEAVGAAIRYPYDSTKFLVERLTRPKELAENLGGPGTMIVATSQAVDEGVWGVVRLAGLLSISVGIFNLLPFPPLDGGQMWIAVVEMFRGGRRLSLATQARVMNMGFAMVILLIGTVLVIDFRRLTGLAGGDEMPKIEKGK